ncbi:hypothetical protein Tco_0423327 [Tanacetum coccineum]
MMSPDRSIVASCEDINGFLAVYTPSNHMIRGTGYSLKDKNEAKTDKTKHGNGKSVKKSKVKVNHKSQQVNDKAKTEEILLGQPVPHLMGRDSPRMII